MRTGWLRPSLIGLADLKAFAAREPPSRTQARDRGSPGYKIASIGRAMTRPSGRNPVRPRRLVAALAASLGLAATATGVLFAGHRRLLAEVGRPGGTLVVGLRSEPKTLNPLVAVDGPSREALYPLHADLVHINRQTQRTE